MALSFFFFNFVIFLYNLMALSLFSNEIKRIAEAANEVRSFQKLIIPWF